ncbi:MAG: serine hydrolase domain-containing protein [Gemmatimonadota bacterium]|nr:serine hydrolase domain-containing protein [Gemmatimonadota bacterium]
MPRHITIRPRRANHDGAITHRTAIRAAGVGLAALALGLTPGSSVRAQAIATDLDARIRTFETSLGPRGDEDPSIRWTIEERMAHYGVPGVSVAVIADGKLLWAKGYGVKQAGSDDPIDTGTAFSVGSVSKVGTAAVTLRLVDEGRLDVDRPVNDYLRRWKVPSNELTEREPVTLRRIMSHTAGLTVHGFADFQPGEALPTVVQILDGEPPAKNAPVRVDLLPGSEFRYSGGGTTVEQLVIEDVTGLDFAAAARRYLFDPLAMDRSTYENPLPLTHENIAKAHGPDGSPRALPRGYETMPESAASGLWTTPSDYAKLIIALIESYQGDGDTFLSHDTARDMMTEVPPGIFGLGPEVGGEGPTRNFVHGGANDSYRALIAGYLAEGGGIVIFTNGTRGSELIGEIRRGIAMAGWPSH